MFMRELTSLGFLLAASTLALGQSSEPPPAPGPARTAAAAPATVGDLAEPLPSSPVIDTREAAGAPGLQEGFGIGRKATDDEIAAIDIDVRPDGKGLPEGSGTYVQGETLYAERCAACHGEKLEGVKGTGAPALIGGRGSLSTPAPIKTVESYWPYASTLFDYVHRAMPMNAPGSLTADEVYALSAYILGRAGVISKDTVLDAKTFRDVRMPNADGFVEDPRPGML